MTLGRDDREGKPCFEALEILERHPFIGRPAQGGLRELVIGEGARGYVARYRYETLDDTVEVLALRAQREGGFQVGEDKALLTAATQRRHSRSHLSV